MSKTLKIQNSDYLLERPPLLGTGNGSCTITLPSGHRYFLKCERKAKDASYRSGWLGVCDDVNASGCGMGLLKEPFEVIAERVERMRVEAAVKKAELEENMFHKIREQEPEDLKLAEEKQQLDNTQTFLWVNKYAPVTFTQLLSDERSNREVLRALKAWDPYVFGRPAPEPAKAQNTNPNAVSSSTGHPSFASTLPPDEEDKRPKQKVVLLSGPPGMGKTTLAHVVAQHAGYRPLEINASDNRTAAELKELVTRAMESQSVFGDRRPNCIILDEVDGIAEGNSAMNALLDIINAPLKRQAGKKGKVPLTRPLILICNDQYAPQLRPLRQIAQIFAFKQTSEDLLIKRLKIICEMEGFRISNEVLRTLCEATGNDVRSCLNTLQFAALKAKSTLKPGDTVAKAIYHAIANGIKDENKDIMEVWRTIYSTGSKNKQRSQFLQNKHLQEISQKPPLKPLDKVIFQIESFGDFSKVLQGVHEHFPKLHYADPTFYKASLVMDWLVFADIFEMRFPAYVPMAGGAVHLLCQTDARPILEMPKKDYMVSLARTQKQNILKAFVDGCRMLTAGRTLATSLLDAVSPLLDVLGPTITGAGGNLDLLSPNDKDRFWTLVKVMASCGLSFVVEHNQQKQIEEDTSPFQQSAPYHLEPNLHELVLFGDEIGLPRPQLSAPMMQMVSHEITLELLRKGKHQDESTLGTKDFLKPDLNPVKDINACDMVDLKRPASNEPEHAKQVLLEKKQKVANFCWFQSQSKDTIKREQKKGENTPKIVYKFTKGFTNAVRRPVFISDLY